MKVASVIEGPYGFHYFKKQDSKVFRPEELNEKMYDKLSPQMPILERAARLAKRPIQFCPKGENLTLMNFGAYTTVLKNDEPVVSKLYQHFDKVFKDLPKRIAKKLR
mgnify:CR=1 FL=1